MDLYSETSNDTFQPFIINKTRGLGSELLLNGETENFGEIENFEEIPSSFKEMSETSRNCVVAYVLLFILASGGNISVFYSVLKEPHKSRINLLILNLSLADLMVTFFAMPLEIIWRLTIQWYGGDLLCKLCQFSRAFALYLSSMIVISISLDRYYAIIYPLKLVGAANRVKRMIITAWIAAALFATPQLFIFGVMRHPQYPSFHQCVTETFLRSDVEQELLYNLFSVSLLYFIPLLIIIFNYTAILCKIYRKFRKQRQNSVEEDVGGVSYTSQSGSTMRDSRLNCGGGHLIEIEGDSPSSLVSMGRDYPVARAPKPPLKKLGLLLRKSKGSGLILARAKIRTLRMTCVIVITFVFCWTPYVFMTLWYMVDREGAKRVSSGIQETLFIMAVANSVVNPLIYGTYTHSNPNPTHSKSFKNSCKSPYYSYPPGRNQSINNNQNNNCNNSRFSGNFNRTSNFNQCGSVVGGGERGNFSQPVHSITTMSIINTHNHNHI